MLRRDTFLAGLIIGALVFFIGTQIFRGLNYLFETYMLDGGDGVRPQFVYMLGCVFNLIPFHLLIRQGRQRALQGVMSFTIFAAIGILLYFNILN